jgi:hypothetical protein
MHMFYQYLSICERPPGDKYIVYRILLLANFKHMFYQYLSICERPPGHLTSRGWKTGRPTSTPPATPFWFRVVLCMGLGQTRLDRLGHGV